METRRRHLIPVSFYLHCLPLPVYGFLSSICFPGEWSYNDPLYGEIKLHIFRCVYFNSNWFGIESVDRTCNRVLYTGTGKDPVMNIVRQSMTGSATNIIAGLSTGMMSTAIPIIIIAFAIVCIF